ncbi:hypothetical protein LINGRAHAP2_LOCUS37044 [Linum grandiflorum]
MAEAGRVSYEKHPPKSSASHYLSPSPIPNPQGSSNPQEFLLWETEGAAGDAPSPPPTTISFYRVPGSSDFLRRVRFSPPVFVLRILFDYGLKSQ